MQSWGLYVQGKHFAASIHFSDSVFELYQDLDTHRLKNCTKRPYVQRKQAFALNGKGFPHVLPASFHNEKVKTFLEY